MDTNKANFNKAPSSQQTPRTDDDGAEAEVSKLAIGLFVLLVYVALVTISGGTVYAVYGWHSQHAGSNGNVIAAVKEMAQIASKQLDAVVSRTSCPTSVVAPCPVVTCKPRPCIPSSSMPPCFTSPAPPREPCPEATPCPSGTCRPAPAPCPTRRPPPPIEMFLNGIRDTKTVSEWLNMYPPLSKSRLIVVTTLLDESIEPWALAGFVHRCNSSAANTAHNTTCSFCQDRYQYVQCVMSNHLIPEPQTEAADDKSYFRQGQEFFQMRGWLPEIVYHYWQPRELDNIFDKIESAIRLFAVKTDVAGKFCQVCADFNRHIYDKCFATVGLTYSPSFGQTNRI